MTVEEARRHIRYTGWASRRLMDAARALSPEDAERSTGISHGSIAGTLSHIHFADRIWYSRLVDPNEPVIRQATLGELETLWPAVQQKWEAWTQGITAADLETVHTFKSPEGVEYQTTTTNVVLHVVNHATLHRGQMMGMIRQLGVPPPPTDFMFYTREVMAGRAT